MTVCPVALAVGCKKCPIFSICPLTAVIGDQPGGAADKPEAGKSGKASGKKKAK